MRAGTLERVIKSAAADALAQRRLQRRHHHCLEPLCSTQMRIQTWRATAHLSLTRTSTHPCMSAAALSNSLHRLIKILEYFIFKLLRPGKFEWPKHCSVILMLIQHGDRWHPCCSPSCYISSGQEFTVHPSTCWMLVFSETEERKSDM